MSTMTTKDGVEIFYKDWGPRNGQPLVFHHSRPLSGDDWDAQMLYFVAQGYRVVAHDRRGHGPLRAVEVPTLVMHGDDDQIVPIADSALLAIKLLKKGTLKVYEKLPHGMCTMHPEVVNPDLLAFIQG